MFVIMVSLHTCIKEIISINIELNFSFDVSCRDVVGVAEAPELTL